MRPILRRFLFCWADFLGDSVARHGRTVLEGSVGMVGKVQEDVRESCFPLLEVMVALKMAHFLSLWDAGKLLT
jgi:hypothetical protein